MSVAGFASWRDVLCIVQKVVLWFLSMKYMLVCEMKLEKSTAPATDWSNCPLSSFAKYQTGLEFGAPKWFWLTYCFR